jgi:hypothetical protein
MIRKMMPGYATLMVQPLHLTVDMNDVRAENSSVMPYYMLIALKGLPHDRTLRAFTQLRLRVLPIPMTVGVFGTYLFPSNALIAYWREGVFNVSAPVVYSYTAHGSHSARPPSTPSHTPFSAQCPLTAWHRPLLPTPFSAQCPLTAWHCAHCRYFHTHPTSTREMSLSMAHTVPALPRHSVPSRAQCPLTAWP